jgi:hypothetical protein
MPVEKSNAPARVPAGLSPFTRPSELRYFGINAHKTTIAAWEKQGRLPPRVHLGYRTVAWRTSELLALLGLDAAQVVAAWRAANEGAAA